MNNPFNFVFENSLNFVCEHSLLFEHSLYDFALIRYPGVYTRVSSYLPWIREMTDACQADAPEKGR